MSLELEGRQAGKPGGWKAERKSGETIPRDPNILSGHNDPNDPNNPNDLNP